MGSGLSNGLLLDSVALKRIEASSLTMSFPTLLIAGPPPRGCVLDSGSNVLAARYASMNRRAFLIQPWLRAVLSGFSG